MIRFIALLLWRITCWVELTLFTLVLYLLSWLPAALRPFYYHLFRVWCRSFIRALGVNLRLHQKNVHPLPAHYILIANHPAAFEDIGIPALFPVYSLAKIEANGVKMYTLEIVPIDAQADGKVVGTCDGHTMKIVYRRG